MKEKFSDRIGITKKFEEIQKDKVTIELANDLWNTFFRILKVFKSSERKSLLEYIWTKYFFFRIDEIPEDIYGQYDLDQIASVIKENYFDSKWYEQLNLINFIAVKKDQTIPIFNTILKNHLSAYRFIGGVLVQINDKEEVEEVQKTLDTLDKYKVVKNHIITSLKLLSDLKTPDYRNSIKESISAVESASKIIANNTKAKLSDALSKIEKKGQLHKALKKGFSGLYGYTSDADGIRHALIEGDNEIKFEDARYMLVTCSAFVNYLIYKHEEL